MTKYLVNLRSMVPVFAEIEVEAESRADACDKAQAYLKDEANAETIQALAWEYGEALGVDLGGLDERDLDAMEVTDAIETEGEAGEDETAATHTRTEDFTDLDKAFL